MLTFREYLLEDTNIKELRVKRFPDITTDTKHIGSGYEASVQSSKDSGTILKELRIKGEPKNNGTYQYIDMVMGHQDNPFFPKIYNAKLYRVDLRGEIHNKLVINMEKLTDFDNEKAAHLFPQLIAQLGIDADFVKTKSILSPGTMSNIGSLPDYREEDEYGTKRSGRKDALDGLGMVLFHEFRTPEGRENLMQMTKNPDLKEALRLTHDILEGSKDKNMHADLTSSNVMLRLTGVGPQLVITDPIISFAE